MKISEADCINHLAHDSPSPCDSSWSALTTGPRMKTPVQRTQSHEKRMCLTWTPVFCKQWFNLKDASSGSVHLRLEWLSLLSSADRLSEVSLHLTPLMTLYCYILYHIVTFSVFDFQIIVEYVEGSDKEKKSKRLFFWFRVCYLK